MAIETAAALHEALARHHLLDTAQLAQIGQAQARFPSARALAKELVQRGLLTPYQVNQLFQGNGRELVLGHYVLLERLGEGGMGLVFKARQQKLGRIVALKVIRKDKLADTEAVQRFRREITVVAQLSHPNVVAAIDADQADEAHFLIMEYVDGVDLGRLVREKGPLPIPLACEYIRQAALGLEHAHAKGLVHRDVKPSNLLLTTSGKGKNEPVIKLLDLGLARVQQPTLDEPSAITQMGIVVGTPDYMSPEQARNASKADIRSDLYSLGCTFYFLLTGQVPFSGDTATEKLIKHCFEQPPPVEQWRPDVPPRVAAIVRRLMAKQPEERYPTPAKLVVALGRPGLLSAAPTKPLSRFFRKMLTAAPVRENAPERLRKAAERRRWLRFNLIGGGVLAALLLVFVSLLFFTGASGRGRNTGPVDPNSGRLPLDALDAKAIPPAEQFPWQPKELVAVIGRHRGHTWGSLQTLAASPDGQYIAGGGADGLLRVWEAATLREIATLREGTHSPIWSLKFSANSALLASGHADGAVHLWEMTRPRPQIRQVLRSLRSYVVFALAFAPDGKTLAAGGNDGQIRLWDLTRAVMPDSAGIRADERAVTALAYAPDGKTLASAGRDDHAIRIWDVAAPGRLSERFPMPLRGHQADITALAFTAAGDRLYSTTHGRYLRIWDVAAGKQLQALEMGRTANTAGTLSPDGRLFVVSPGPTYSVQLWDLTGPEPRERTRLSSASQGAHLMALASNGKVLVSAGNHRLQVWDVSGKPRLLGRSDDSQDVRVLAFHNDGRTLATGGYNGRVRLWDLGNADPVEQAELNAHASIVSSVRFSPDGQQLASAGFDGVWRLWTFAGGKASDLATLPGFKGAVTALEFAGDGKTLAIACQDGTIRLYDLSSGKPVPRGEPLLTATAANEQVVGLALDAQGKNLAARFANRNGRLWDLTGPKPRARELRYPQIGITALDFAPDAATLAVGTTAGIRLWDMTPEPKERGELAFLVPSGPVQALAFAPGGRTLAASYAGRLVLWDVGGLKATREWEFPGGVNGLAFAPDGRHLFTANSNGTVYVLRLGAPMFR